MGVVAIEKKTFGSPSTTVANFFVQTNNVVQEHGFYQSELESKDYYTGKSWAVVLASA